MGRKIGSIPWNKGLNKLIDERVKIIAQKKTGKKRSEYTKNKMSSARKELFRNGYKHPLLGIKRLDITGEKHFNWKNGNSRYYKEGWWSKEYLIWRTSIFERDNYTCQNCGLRGVYLEAHHIKEWCNYPELRFNTDNGLTLCKGCHNLTKLGRRTKTLQY